MLLLIFGAAAAVIWVAGIQLSNQTDVVAGSQLPSDLIIARVAPAGALIAVLWVAGLLLLQGAGTSLPWHESALGVATGVGVRALIGTLRYAGVAQDDAPVVASSAADATWAVGCADGRATEPVMYDESRLG